MKEIDCQIRQYLEYCEKVRCMSPVTLGAKKNVLGRFVKVTMINNVGDITNEVFNKWVEHETGREINLRSVNAYNAVVLAMVRYYRGVGVRVPLNMSLIQRMYAGESQRKFYTADEVAAVVRQADGATKLMIVIMFETGMRIAELCRLRVTDFEGRRIRFVGKGRKAREVYVTARTLGLVRDYIMRYNVRGYMWCVNDGVMSLNGEPPTVNTVRLRMRRAFEVAGFEGFYPHALRHSFATDLQLRGASIAEIKEMIGHSSVATTERYLHGFDGKLKELFDKYR